MASGKNNIPHATHLRLEPTSDTAQRFRESKAIGNKAQTFVALSPTLDDANEAMKRSGLTRITRNCILTQYSECVNTPSMDTPAFTFWTSEPASEQIILTMDVDYPTSDLIKVLNGLQEETSKD